MVEGDQILEEEIDQSYEPSEEGFLNNYSLSRDRLICIVFGNRS